MKVAQMLSTIPDALPADFAAELMRLQSQAPPMGAAFVRRRMQAELGPDWRGRFAEFDFKPAAAASLGQVHRAVSLAGERLACKLQYPDMASAVETDLSNLDLLFSLHRRAGAAIDTREIAGEIRERVREELDYQREARIARLYRVMLADRPFVRVPRVEESLSTRRLLTLQWLDGEPLVAFESGVPGSARRNRRRAVRRVVATVPPLRRHPRRSASRQLHGRRVGRGGRARRRGRQPVRLWLRAHLSAAVRGRRGRALSGAEGEQQGANRRRLRDVGLRKLTPGITDAMTVWARFMCGPILDDRVRTAADGVKPAEYGRREIGEVMRALRAEGGGLPPPREFVFLERATIGLGGAFLRLGARLNFHRMYEDAIAGFDEATVARRQAGALEAVGLTEASAPLSGREEGRVR